MDKKKGLLLTWLHLPEVEGGGQILPLDDEEDSDDPFEIQPTRKYLLQIQNLGTENSRDSSQTSPTASASLGNSPVEGGNLLPKRLCIKTCQ